MNNIKSTAIVLAAGQGKRMQSKVQKQYMLLEGKPILYYSLKAFEESFVDNIVIVVGKGEEEYVKKEIIDKYGLKKITAITNGGKERYHSVAAGIEAINWDCDYCMIHDGARPFLTQQILKRAIEGAIETKACVVGMPVKDTIKIVDENHDVESTPNRSRVWLVQTPQTFDFALIKNAYERLIQEEEKLIHNGVQVTDDAMVVEYFENIKVRLVEGSYTNIKITTPDDLDVGREYLKMIDN